MSEKPIVFFDGVCGLCNAAVDFILKHDRKQVFVFAALQGETAQKILGVRPDDDLTTMVLLENGQQLRHSDAVLRIAWHLGGIWRVLSWARIILKSLRDLVYNWISRNRLRWFGKKESCRLPTPAERARFLT